MPTSIKPDRDLSRLHPLVRKKVKAILADLKKNDIPFEVFEAARTPQRQAHLYAKGRTTSGNKVTWVRPWGSIHQYGMAVDLVLNPGGNKWSWDDSGSKAAWWDKMHVIAKQHGMTPLYKNGRLIEKPHIQLMDVSASSLRSGEYPAGGDASWADHLSAMIDGWNGPQAAPPKPDIEPVPPGPAADMMDELEADTDPAAQDALDAIDVLASAAADEKFQRLHKFIAWAEGGFASHPDDNDGGATNFGITRKTLADWRGRPVSIDEVRNLTKSEAQEIMRTNYYARTRCGEMPERLALVVYNTAVMSGPGRAAKMLQSAFNATGLTLAGKPLVVDGILGSNTMQAITDTDPMLLSDKFIDLYVAYLRSLSNFGTFGNGWLNRIAKMREYRETLPQSFGKRPEVALTVVEQAAPVAAPAPAVPAAETAKTRDLEDLLPIIIAAATGGKRAVLRAVLARALGRETGLPSSLASLSTLQPALSAVVKGDKSDALDALLGLIDDDDDPKGEPGKPPLTPVNAALGETLGRALNGKKSVIGVVALLASAIVPELGILTDGAQKLLDGENQTILLTLSSLFTGWGFLGKIDKAVRTANPHP